MKTIVPALAATLFIALAAPAAAAVSDTDGAKARCGFVAEIGSYVCETKLPAGSLSEMSSAPQVGPQKLVPVLLGNPGHVQIVGGNKKP